MQTVSSRMWTRNTMSFSHDDDYYTTNASLMYLFIYDNIITFSYYIYIYIYIYIYQVTLMAWISLTLSHHLSLSSITSGKSSRLHSVSVESCCLWVLVGRPTLARLLKRVHWRTSLMSSFLLQQCPECIVRLIRIVLEIGGKCPYSCCLMRCCFQNLFKIACSIWGQLPLSFFFSIHFFSVHVVHPYGRIDTIAAWKILRFISWDSSDFPMIDNLWIAVHAFASDVPFGRWDGLTWTCPLISEIHHLDWRWLFLD